MPKILGKLDQHDIPAALQELQVANIPISTASNAAELLVDLNLLLAAMKASGIMVAD